MALYWYSKEKKKWFHLLVGLIKSDKAMLYLTIPFLYALFAYRIEYLRLSFDIAKDWCDAINEILFAISGGYISGYIIYLLSVLVPKAKRQRSRLRIIKDICWYAKGEIEFLIRGDATKNKEDVLAFLKEGSQLRKVPESDGGDFYEIKFQKTEYIMHFLNYLSSTLNTVMQHSDYLDDKNLHLIAEIMSRVNKITSRLKDSDGHPFYGKNDMDELANGISFAYDRFVQIYNELNKLV